MICGFLIQARKQVPEEIFFNADKSETGVKVASAIDAQKGTACTTLNGIIIESHNSGDAVYESDQDR
jgi:hypothetical protein